MLVVSMSVSMDGFVFDRDGGIDWGAPSDDLFEHQLEHVGSLGGYLLGRRLYEMMRVWETDPALRDTAAHRSFGEVWAALPKVVFSRTLDRVDGNARLATGSLAEEVARALDATGKDVSIGAATLAGQAIELDLVDELRMLRIPVLLGGGTPLLPPVAEARRFDVAEVRTFENGAVLERYRRSR